MSQIIKAFTGVFILLYMAISAMGILGAFVQVSHAQNVHAAMIHEVENSNYARMVIEECFSVAEDNGYNLSFVFYWEDRGSFVCTSSSNLPENLREISMARVALVFPIEIKFLGIHLEQEVFGYGR